MTKEGGKTGYCCCPRFHYTIAFYDKTNNYKNYYVDTAEFIDKIRIFQTSYQYSYIVDKIKWIRFLNKLEVIDYNEYYTSDIKKARKVYEYTIEKNLPIINSNRCSQEWMNFDGDFKIKVATVGDYLEETQVYKNIKKAYPNEKYKIEKISRYQMCGSHVGNDCYEEIVLQIFCNRNFYDKFKIYSPKSFFDEAFAEFYVLGTRKELNKIDSIAEREK